MRQITERTAAAILQEQGLQAPPGQAAAVFAASDGFEMTGDDEAEWQRPLQQVAHFLIGRDGVIRWARAEMRLTVLPTTEELLHLL